MSSDFKELNLDRTRLKDCVEEYCESKNIEGLQYSSETENRHRVKYRENEKDVVVEFMFKSNGTTTIHTKLGKHHEIGRELAVYLKEKLVDDQRKNVSITVKDICESTFKILLEFLTDIKNEDSDIPSISVHKKQEDATKISVKITSQYNDSLNLTFYQSAQKLLLQGKPLYGYTQVIYFLSDFTDLNGFISIISKGEEDVSSINIDEENIEDELKKLLPNSYSHLGDTLLIMLRTSWTLKGIPISLPDYSCYVYPVLRALEGVMRRMLFQRGFSVTNDSSNQLGKLFYKDSNGKFKIKNEFMSQGIDSKTCNALEHCYTYFVQNRHTLFHSEDFTDASRIIDKKERAVKMIEKILEIIDKAYVLAN